MSKRVLGIVVVIGAVLVAAVTGLALSNPSSPVTIRPTSSAEGPRDDPPAAEADASPAPAAGRYLEYSSTAIAEADGRVLLFFHASWCPQCIAIEDDIEADGAPTGVTIVKVDYDSNHDLRVRYGVTLQTTFVEVSSDGTELQKYVAYDDPRLSAVVEAML